MKNCILCVFFLTFALGCIAQKKDTSDKISYLDIKTSKGNFILETDNKNNSICFYSKSDTLYKSYLGYENKVNEGISNPSSFFDIFRATSKIKIKNILLSIIGQKGMDNQIDKGISIGYILDRSGKVVEVRFFLNKGSKIKNDQLIELYFQIKEKKIFSLLSLYEKGFNESDYYKNLKYIRTKVNYNFKKLIELDAD